MTLLALTGGCAAPPLESSNTQRDPGPDEVTAAAEGTVFLWGGLLIGIEDLPDGNTQMEVLALPLNTAGQPREGGEPRGRFLAVSPEPHDPTEFRAGQRVLVRGRLTDFQEGRLGEITYRYPQLYCDAVHLWGENGRSPGGSWHFGLGIGIGL